MNKDMRDHNFEAEQWLDRALAEYAKAEPRPGFERRMLARLQSEPERSRERTWWRLAFAVGAMAIFPVTLLWLRPPGHPQISGTLNTKAAVQLSPQLTENTGSTNPIAALSKRPRSQTKGHGAPPKQQQFPAAVPLTDQERMLMQYVQDFPEKAALTAQAQTDLQKQNELEMAGPGPQKESQDLGRKQ